MESKAGHIYATQFHPVRGEEAEAEACRGRRTDLGAATSTPPPPGVPSARTPPHTHDPQEKPLFEWTLSETAINHGFNSVRANYWPSLYFVQVSRGNSRRFASIDDEEAALIYGHAATDTRSISGFEECYFFAPAA